MKLFLLLAIAFISATATAQQLERAKKLLQDKKTAEAKVQIDSLFLKKYTEKDKEANFLKSRIYIAVAADPQLYKLYPDSRVVAWKALYRYVQLDTNILYLQLYSYAPFDDLYRGFYAEGAAAYNKSDWEGALAGFGNAADVSSLMIAKRVSNIKVDTMTVLYAAAAAEKLERWDQVAKLYGLLADGKIMREGFSGAYAWLTNYHVEMKDKTAARHYFAIGKELYPGDTSWTRIGRAIEQLEDKKPVVTVDEKPARKPDTGPPAPVQPVSVIIQKHIAAIGGNAVIAAIRSIETTTSIDMMETELTGKTFLLTGKGYKSVADFNGQEMIQVLTTAGGWSMSALVGQYEPVALDPVQMKNAQELLGVGGLLYDYSAKGAKVAFESSEKLEGVNVYKLRYTKPGGTVFYLFIDAATYYLLRTETSLTADGKVTKSITDYSDYRKTGPGYVMAYKTIAGAGVEMTTTITAVRFNVPMDLRIFDPPKK